MGRPKGSKNKPKLPTENTKPSSLVSQYTKAYRLAREWAIKPTPQDIEDWLRLVETRDDVRRGEQISLSKQIAGAKSYWFLIQRFYEKEITTDELYSM